MNPIAISENNLALSELSKLMATKKEYQNKICEIMQVRLFISTIKYGKRKKTAFRELFRLYRNQEIKIKNLVYVMVLMTAFQIRLKISSQRIVNISEIEK
jgi:hypothetical protein